MLARDARAQDGSEKDERLLSGLFAHNFNEAAAQDALAAGANINAKHRVLSGGTMLMLASKVSQEPRVIKFLLDHGADTTLKDESGRTALSYARESIIGRDQAGRDIIKMLEGRGRTGGGTRRADWRAGHPPRHGRQVSPAGSSCSPHTDCNSRAETAGPSERPANS